MNSFQNGFLVLGMTGALITFFIMTLTISRDIECRPTQWRLPGLFISTAITGVLFALVAFNA